MKKKNPIERSIYIHEQYKEYLRSSFYFKNAKLQKLFKQQLEKEDLFKGPYVDLILPFQRGKCLDELIEEGVVCNSFKELGDMDFERPLYYHQEKAIRHICSGKSAVITTGTGSGKTESFLYPILNEIMKDIENGNNDAGIRAVFLYPMNALVNDQIDRVRKILSQYPLIKFGFFTGDTKESVGNNYRQVKSEESGINIPENELVSRQEIRATPPHLLFTNYSMLEYLLIRPNDYSIFSPKLLNNWKFVVLDEAHSYYGALGIEISLLMRRVTGLSPKKPRFILTSATLGAEGKSEAEIVEFARNLTSAPFEISDIIFSKRIPFDYKNLEYAVENDDYSRIKAVMYDYDAVEKLVNKYIKIKSSNVKEYLFELLSRDKNVYNLFNILKNSSKSFKHILTAFDNSISGTQLVDMIDLINQAEKNGIGIFDLKYHSFVRPIAGAYITLEKNTKLSLTKTNIIEGLKAFEIGNCKYCNAPYIIGKICKNEIKGIDYLLQNKEVDIYENYGDNANARIDYFLLDNRINDEEVDCNILEEYRVCSKCGAIHAANNLVAHRCECGSEYSVTIYKVLSNKDSDDSFLFNNVSQCPCCGHSGKSGVVKSLNVGKDEGTALIAQMLLEAMDDGEETVPVKRKLSLSENKVNESVKKTTNVKQFLAFSDSRQQASFAAMFLEANYTRMIRKRLIWDVIEKNNYHDITFDELTSQLTTAINERDLFTNDLSAQKNAWLTALIDLLKVDGAYDGEGLGLYYFDLDLKDILDSIEEDDVSEVFGKYNLTKSDLATMIQIVFNVFKVTPAIDYTKSTLTDEEKKQFLDYRRFNNYIMFQKQKAVRTYNSKKADQNIRSFLPVNGKSNMVVRYVQKVCVCDEESAKYVLNIIFNNIAVAGALLKRHSTKEIYQIYASKYILKNYKKSKYYICSKCGRLTPYNIHGKCIQDRCEGVLKEVDPDEILAFNYYRRQYMTKKIEKIVVKEHTAQLKREEARQYQLDFKNKNINILSCSTTFEMGIDIGSLETVFMRNVPPTPANYVQRAGRAGRRRDSSAYILTYCGTGSHDYTYFCEPEKMIAGVIKPPYFNVLNHKIIVRHLMAICLGYFFRNNPEYFQNVGFLVFENGFEKFKTYMLSHPKDLNSYINEKVFPENIYKRYHDFQWFDEIDGDDEKINNFVETMKGIVVGYNNARQEALEEEDYKDAERWSREIEKIYDGRVIDSLSKYCVIPKYGFPVDVVELKIYNNGIFENSYDLNRDLRVAISEYAPDSEVIVDGKKYTSKYITLPKKGEFTRNYFCTCHNCRKVNVYISTKTENECKYCGEHISLVDTEFYIEPKYGFKTGITKESTRMKPKRSYAGEVSYLGGGIKDEKKVEIGNVIYIESSSNDELLVMNKSVFYMCPKCGYSQISFGDDRRPSLSVKHKNVGQYDCKNDVLEKIKLGHRFKTDVTRFIIPTLESNEKDSYSKALSFMYAFIEGISNLLYIERNDIDGVLEMNLDNHSYDILVYDNVPGGAGHVKRLLNEDAVVESLRAAFAKVSQHCCDENTSCYNCLRNYYNQSYHSKIKRGYAKEFIELLLKSLGK